MNPLIVSKTEASKLLNISVNKMLKLLEAGEIPAYKDDGQWKVPVKSIESYIERRISNGYK